MPQMSPLAWAPLMIITITLMTAISTHLFWTTTPPPMKKMGLLTKVPHPWKW